MKKIVIVVMALLFVQLGAKIAKADGITQIRKATQNIALSKKVVEYDKIRRAGEADSSDDVIDGGAGWDGIYEGPGVDPYIEDSDSDYDKIEEHQIELLKNIDANDAQFLVCDAIFNKYQDEKIGIEELCSFVGECLGTDTVNPWKRLKIVCSFLF